MTMQKPTKAELEIRIGNLETKLSAARKILHTLERDKELNPNLAEYVANLKNECREDFALIYSHDYRGTFKRR